MDGTGLASAAPLAVLATSLRYYRDCKYGGVLSDSATAGRLAKRSKELPTKGARWTERATKQMDEQCVQLELGPRGKSKVG
jgi:hypothetical protein